MRFRILKPKKIKIRLFCVVRKSRCLYFGLSKCKNVRSGMMESFFVVVKFVTNQEIRAESHLQYIMKTRLSERQ